MRRGGLERGRLIRWHQGDSGVVELEKVGYLWDLVSGQDGAKWRRRKMIFLGLSRCWWLCYVAKGILFSAVEVKKLG